MSERSEQTAGTSSGVVRVWHAEARWGVIDSPDTPGGCRAASAAVDAAEELRAGQPVEFRWEQRDADGFRFLATAVAPTRDQTLGA